MNIENLTLACILIDRSIHEMVIPLLKEQYFTGKNAGLFKLIRRMFDKAEQIDTYTLITKIGTSNKIWSVGDLTELSGMVASTANVMSYVQALKFNYQRRMLHQMFGIQIDETGDPTEKISELIGSLEQLQQDGVISKNRDIVTIVDDALNQIEVETKTVGLLGVPTSIGMVNHDTRGLRGGELIIIAGRPGHGKTAVALSWVKAACLRGKTVAMFTMEMRDAELVKRLIRSYDDRMAGAGEISSYPIHLFDRGGIDVDYIRSNVRLLRAVDMVVVDYLGLMKVNGRLKRSEALGEVTRQLKAFALDMNIPIVLLSQLNRDVEARAAWQHRLSDLRESGDIEQDADKVFFVNTPEAMQLEEVTINGQTIGTNNLTIIQKLKDRNGKAPIFYKTKRNATFTEFYDYDEYNAASTEPF